MSPLPNLSLRLKILFLIVLTLGASLALYLYFGTQLIVQDKTSYIYDYGLGQLAKAAISIEDQIEQIQTDAALLMKSPTSPSSPSERAPFPLLFLNWGDPTRLPGFSALRSFGDEKILTALLAKTGWTRKNYESSDLIVGSLSDGFLPIGGKIKTSQTQSLAYFALMEFKKGVLEGGSDRFQLFLMDSDNRIVLSSAGADPEGLSKSAVEGFSKALPAEDFKSGAQDWKLNEKDYIASYRRIASNRLTLISFIPKSEAFHAADALVHRSIAMGIAIFVIALGFTLILSSGMTDRLRELEGLTRKVAQGDFSVRVRTRSKWQDEIGALGISFNTMAGKINELISEVADKARMEKELETAQIVQKRFFPAENFHSPSLHLCGRTVPASECSGDWWHYSKVGNQLLAVLGDVTGHGASAALVTASVHGAYSSAVKLFSQTPDAKLSLARILEDLHTEVLKAGGGQTRMSFLAFSIDLNSRMLHVANAGHAPLYLYRRSDQKSLMSALQPLTLSPGTELGTHQGLLLQTSSTQLNAEDLLVCFTDGLFEPRAKDEQALTKRWLAEAIVNQVTNSSSKGVQGKDVASAVCERLVSEAERFFGYPGMSCPDDVTVVVAAIPVS